MVSNEPHLLSSRPQRLLENKRLLQQHLDVEDVAMQRIVTKARRSVLQTVLLHESCRSCMCVSAG
jgi:hypothetical protein